MTKHELLKQAFDRWIHRLGLAWWTIEVIYYDDPAEIVKRFRNDGDILVLARTFTEWKYGTATIWITLPAWDQVEDDDIEVPVVHELMHVLVNEMREGELHHEERVVTQLTKALFWAIDGVKSEINQPAGS